MALCLSWVVQDVQLVIFANMLDMSLFLLVVLYYYMGVNSPKKQELEWHVLCPQGSRI